MPSSSSPQPQGTGVDPGLKPRGRPRAFGPFAGPFTKPETAIWLWDRAFSVNTSVYEAEGQSFESNRAHSQIFTVWRQLERPDLGPDFADLYAEKLAAIGGSADPAIGPVDLVVFLYGLTQAWLLTPRDLLAADGSDPESAERLAAHRAAVVAAAERISSPVE